MHLKERIWLALLLEKNIQASYVESVNYNRRTGLVQVNWRGVIGDETLTTFFSEEEVCRELSYKHGYLDT